MEAHWALDLGTTNSGLARWDPDTSQAVMVRLPAVCRDADATDPLEAPTMIPSATQIVESPDFWTILGAQPILRDWVFWGRQAWIGREALSRNQNLYQPSFAPMFKSYLGTEPLRTIARGRDGEAFSARTVASSYLRELLVEAKKVTGERIRAITVTAPVESFESYRAEVRSILKQLGVRKVFFADEPVAAAAGYGVTLSSSKRVLVVDFGGGTLDLALVDLDPAEAREGRCHVVAKAGRAIGGRTVDAWLLRALSTWKDFRVPDPDNPSEAFWHRWLTSECRRIKEQLFFQDRTDMLLSPPDSLRGLSAQLRGRGTGQVSREQLVDVLRENRLYDALENCTDELLAQVVEDGRAVDEVLMVGGSVLLPGVFPVFEKRFGRDRVRAWEPFEAVVRGACALGAGGFAQSDFIAHDYAFVTYDPRTNARQYQTIVPRGTRFPTRPDLWKRQMVPTCALGEPETQFQLVVCEVGRARQGEQGFAFDEAGRVRKLECGDGKLVVPLNESSPMMGTLNPPHQPGDRTPRLEVSFGVNADRWLVVTVKDLRSGKMLHTEDPVIRLL